MEADWEIEIGEDAPVIDAEWEGTLDLVQQPELACTLPEAKQQKGLSELLIALNGKWSAVRTSKCDVWESDEIDPYEFDAAPDEPLVGVTCYIDILPREPHAELEEMQSWAKSVVARLRAEPFAVARVDLLLRRSAWETGEGVGITLYATGCGGTEAVATVRLAELLARLAVLLPTISSKNSVQ
jgi:hypothetical protein